jgi:hypothetical protein
LEYTKNEGVEEMRKFVVCLVMLLLVASPAAACIGARQAAMGWAGVAISDDATASYWNPAALVWAKDGVFYDNISNRTAIAAKYQHYGFFLVDEWDKSYCLLSHGIQLTENSAFGFNIGWEHHTAGFCSYNGPSADLSYVWAKDGVTIAVLAQNFGNIRPALAYSNQCIVITASAYDLLNLCQLRHFQTGIEIVPVSFLAVRGGYNSLYDGFAYGVGLNASLVSLDFVSILNKISFSITFKP